MKKLSHIFALAAISAIIPAAASAQSVTSGVFSLDALSDNSVSAAPQDMFMPPNLSVNVEFIDTDGSGVLNALEQAKIRLTITNEGGDASNVKVTVFPEQSYRGISMTGNELLTTILSGRNSILDFPLAAGLDVETAKDRKFKIKIYEPLGYDIEAVLNLPTMEYIKPRLIMNGVIDVSDSGYGLMARNGIPDGKVQSGDIVSVSLLLQNAGAGNASDVTYTIASRDENVLLYTNTGPTRSLTGNLGDMFSGMTQELSFRVSANNRYVNNGGYLPVYITLNEKMGLGNLKSTIIPIPFDAVPIKPEVVSVDADLDRMIASIGKVNVVSVSGRIGSTKTAKDISVPPVGKPLYKDAIAVVLGTETYADGMIPDAPYAKRDAEIMGGYFAKALGVGDVRVMTDKEVTSMGLTMLFDAQKGRLARQIQPGVTDLFIYYSGHGVPVEDEKGKMDVLLVPYDVEKSFINDYGFSLNKMYKDLAALDARSVTVILDACFSGGSRYSASHKSENISGQKLVMIKESAMEQPWRNNPSFRVFTSSQGNQTSLGNDMSRSGLFTYYIALGLQGEADKNKDGSVAMSELVEYVSANVNKDSEGAQSPQFYGDDNFILEKIR